MHHNNQELHPPVCWAALGLPTKQKGLLRRKKEFHTGEVRAVVFKSKGGFTEAGCLAKGRFLSLPEGECFRSLGDWSCARAGLGFAGHCGLYL